MAEAAVTVEETSKEHMKTEEKQPNKNLCEEAIHNFLAGKRHMLVKDFSHAVQSLAKACELYIEHYGELAPECGNVYFLYGKALFQLFQQQAGIFGDTVPEGSSNEEEEEEEEEDADSDEEKDKGSNEEDDKTGEENDDTKEDDSESITSSKDDEKTDSMDGIKPATEPIVKEDGDAAVSSTVVELSPEKSDSVPMEQTEENKPDSVEAGPSTSKSKPPKSEDEFSDLQLAWENLEIARSIFQKQGKDSKDAQLKVAEILLLLGEISLECDNYEAAIKDLKECLEIWQRYLSPDDRRIAETYYQLGLAHQLDDQSQKALDLFQSTIDVIQLRICNLKNQTVIEQNADGFDIDPNVEIQELETLLPDIKAKMEDTKDLDKETKKAIEELTLQKVEEVAQVNSTSEEKPVKNISHLLKRKKPDDQDSSKTEDVKKIKLSSPTGSTEEQA